MLKIGTKVYTIVSNNIVCSTISQIRICGTEEIDINYSLNGIEYLEFKTDELYPNMEQLFDNLRENMIAVRVK